jgi:hypothetical protein
MVGAGGFVIEVPRSPPHALPALSRAIERVIYTDSFEYVFEPDAPVRGSITG